MSGAAESRSSEASGDLIATTRRAARSAARWTPDRVFSRALCVRAALVWLIMRGVAMGGQQASPLSGADQGLVAVVSLRPVALVFLYGMVTATVLLDARARREDQFLASLGTSRIGISSVVVATVTALEAVVFLAVRALAE